MFTVIFAEKETIKLFEETKMFFGPLYNSKQVAFCEWNKEAVDFDAMVPNLYDLIEYHNEWRALILYDDDFEKLNPFDFTDYSESFFDKNEKNWEYFRNRREQRIAAYEKAVSNPLLKLTTALTGVSGLKAGLTDKEYTQMRNGEIQTYEYMLKKQLSELNCLELAGRFEKYQREQLLRFVEEDKIDLLISYIKSESVSGIISLIPDTEILRFIKYIGNDPMYFDPEYTECLIEQTKKHELLIRLCDNFSMKDKLPQDVICVSPRTFNFEKVEQEIKWKKKDEFSSSKFADYNLYNDKLKFILFDILSKENKQYKFAQIKFLCFLLVVANNDVPQGLVKANNVYRAQIEFNSDIVTKICEKYISKLKATQLLLRDIEMQLDCDNETSVDNKTAQRLYESNIKIPVDITANTNESELYADYKGLGLSTDCPSDESTYWSQQYRAINKSFVKYLREPKRAVKRAVNEGLRNNNVVNDDKSLLLSETQIEDVKFHIAETEQKLLDKTTINMFDTKKFNEELQEADKVIKHGISQRMTKKKTVFVGLVAVAAYFVGFLPLLFGNLNTINSFLFSLMLTGILLGIFLIIGFIYLFVLKRKLVKRFKHFNYVMGGICSQINGALVKFSSYITDVCNMMRDFSILKKRDSAVTKTKRILAYHNIQISKKVKDVHEMFSKYVDFSQVNIMECAPYEFDFTVLREYSYEMPSVKSPKRIDFLQSGNEITIPIDYVESVTLTREELYD